MRFNPFDDDGFSLRGDKRQLLYKGRCRSHRFTILNDGAFEYDCILEKEPDSNIVSLFMDGAENYDFFRQPDFVPDDFLKGSFAVYRKETFIGQGTGKLCHIHRPLIIDARGRKAWGDLSVVGNELRITIPEKWLSEAKYPVVVDPTIGTTTVGSQNRWRPEPGNPLETLLFEMAVPVNRYLVTEAINGLCTAFYYTNQHDGEGGGFPVLYTDNNDKPNLRRSSGENFIDLRFIGGNNAGWRSGNFSGNGISANSYIWFGLYTEYYWYPRFDYGAKCYALVTEDGIFNTYPMPSWIGFYDLKLSMYFSYVSSQNYLRTLTQGITLEDTKKENTVFNRLVSDTQCVSDLFQIFKTYIITILEKVKCLTDTIREGQFFRKETDLIHAQGSVFKHLIITIKILTNLFVRDYTIRRFLIAKENLILKSIITKDLILESKIN